MSSNIKCYIDNINKELKNFEEYKEFFEYMMGSPIVKKYLKKNKKLELQNKKLISTLLQYKILIDTLNANTTPCKCSKQHNSIQQLRIKLVKTTELISASRPSPPLRVNDRMPEALPAMYFCTSACSGWSGSPA